MIEGVAANVLKWCVHLKILNYNEVIYVKLTCTILTSCNIDVSLPSKTDANADLAHAERKQEQTLKPKFKQRRF